MSAPAPDSTSTSARISAAFSKLTESAKSINSISARLNKQIAAVENCLRQINVGVGCWTTINKGDSGRGEYWSQNVGFTRINGKWCIAIQTLEGADWADADKTEDWPFAEAPRYLQPKAVDKIPELIESLIAATDAAAERLEEKILPAEEIATAVNAVVFHKKK